MIIQILDGLCHINNRGLDGKSSTLSKEDLKSMASELSKLLALYEIFAHNKLNSLIIKQLHGIDSLTELLKCFGNHMSNDQIMIDIEAKILKCIAVSARNDKICQQLLDNSKDAKNLSYITDIISEQLKMVKWSKHNLLQDTVIKDAELLRWCFNVIQ